MQAKPTEAQNDAEVREKDYSSRLSGAISNSLFTLGDLFKDSNGPKNVRFPKDLLKVLEQKLQDIAMGKDAACVLSLTSS